MTTGLKAIISLTAGLLLMAAVACGSAASPAASPVPTQPPATGAPGTQTPADTVPATGIPATEAPTAEAPATEVPATEVPATEVPAESDTIEVEAPIEQVALVIAESDPLQYMLSITSGLPSGCAEFSGYEVSRDGFQVNVAVTNLMPAAPVPCTTIYGYHEGNVNLGSNFEAGMTYTVMVNGKATNAFTAMDDDMMGMSVNLSPIEKIELAPPSADSGGYTLTVVSGLPLGSACSKFFGYDVNNVAGTDFEVTLKHLEVTAQNVACTADYPVVVTEIPLGDGFESDQAYDVSVNGQATGSFVGQEEGSEGMVLKASPIEEAEVAASERITGAYTLNVISRLPLGSTCSSFFGYEVNPGSANSIEVTVNHLEVAQENAPCTKDLPAVSTEIPLGTDFISGQTYTVTVNGDTETTFEAN